MNSAKILSLFVLFVCVSTLACRSVGERTAYLAEHGQGYWRPAKRINGFDVREFIVNEHVFEREWRSNGALKKREGLREDGSLHSIHEFRGAEETHRIFKKNGKLSVLWKEAGGRQVFWQTYGENGEVLTTVRN